MNRFEENIKNSFEHFEPEVDPKLWQHISQQLPSAPQVPSGAASAGKGLVVKLGVKTVIGLITAATFTGLTLWYFASKQAPVDPVATGKAVPVAPVEAPQNTENMDAVATPANPIQPNKEMQVERAQVSSSGRDLSAQKTKPSAADFQAIALTGNTPSGKGESLNNPDSPALIASPKAAASGAGQNAAPTVSTSITSASQPAPAKTEKPLLILSSKGGFAPLTITALTNQEGVSSQFDFGDGIGAAEGISSSHTYQEPGIYTVRCVTNGIALEQKIQVIGQIPSAFSPNGDGVNDAFTINTIEGLNIELNIFNRAGRLMYKGNGPAISWDGKTPDGQNAEAGTYLYNIFATSEGGVTYKQKGTIHLFR